MKAAGTVKSRVVRFSLNDNGADAMYRDGSIMIRRVKGVIAAADASKMRILGIHNIQNAMAALLMCAAMCDFAGRQADFAAMADALYRFDALEHRMERVGEFMGRTFINDSKATTVGAVEMAVRGFDGNCVLILGGRTKGDDYSRLVPGLAGRVRGIVLIGESSGEFSRIFSGFSLDLGGSMDDAVARAMAMSEAGDSVLLSPACTSFDMFENYEERGRAFRAAFERLSAGELRWT
jgi:UDP-N-acetylmuramoylalanine--D-glutamate ligase